MSYWRKQQNIPPVICNNDFEQNFQTNLPNLVRCTHAFLDVFVEFITG